MHYYIFCRVLLHVNYVCIIRFLNIRLQLMKTYDILHAIILILTENKIRETRANEIFVTGDSTLTTTLRENYAYIDLIQDSANAVPTTKNYTPEIPTLGVFAKVSLTVVQWKSLALKEPPSRSR